MLPIQLPNHIIESINAFRCATNNSIAYLSDDLILFIYSFVISNYYGNVINKFIVHYIKTKKAIKNIIKNCFNNNCSTLITEKHISSMRFLITANITRKFNLNFWANLLQVLSSSLNLLQFLYRSEITDEIKSSDKKKIIVSLDLWLQLCKKFDLKIYLRTKFSHKYIRSTHIPKMNNYDKYIIMPMIVQPFSDINLINIEFSKQYLSNFIISL